MATTLGERIQDEQEAERRANDNAAANMRVAVPGIIQSFDPEKQTATVQPAIQDSLNGVATALPLLLDVPVQFPHAGGYCMTFPVKSGDECLVIFSDMCIDAWYQSGGVQNQLEKRRHDLSDGMAILGITSQPKVIPGFNSDTTQFRNEDGDTYVEIDESKNVNIKAAKVTIDAAEIETTGNISTAGTIQAAEGKFGQPEQWVYATQHKHGGVVTGSSQTSEPVPEG
jgi:hypothetical protein